MQNRRHSTDQDKIYLRPDQRRNDLREINGHRSFVLAFRQRGEDGVGRVSDDGKQRASRPARGALALLPVADGFDGYAEP